MTKGMMDDYSQYDALNTPNNTLIKILVSYIKPSQLFKTNILTPIHVGRAVEKSPSKDGVPSEQDLQWLHENCIGDDEFEGNISQYNRRVGFLTGTYWAWKNYEKLGNPDYFGSFGYARLFKSDFLRQLTDYDFFLPVKKDFQIRTIKEQMIAYHGEDLYNNMLYLMVQIYPQEEEAFKQYLQGTSGYFDEIYVMKRDLFFAFCEWIFPLLFACLNSPSVHLKNNDLRDIGFMMERLTGYYCNKLTKSCRFLEVDVCTLQHFTVNRNILDKNLLSQLKNKIRK